MIASQYDTAYPRVPSRTRVGKVPARETLPKGYRVPE